MGLLRDVLSEVGKVVGSSSRSSGRSKKRSRKRAKPASSQPSVPEALRGPDPGTLITADDIEEATTSRPVGEGDRKSGGQDLDVGYFRVCIWPLADGGELLINSTRIRDEDGVALWRSRWDDPSWQNVDDEKHLDGVGEAARWYVTKSHKGGSELHVSAKQGMYVAQLVHSSPTGATDIAPLTKLMVTVLARLDG